MEIECMVSVRSIQSLTGIASVLKSFCCPSRIAVQRVLYKGSAFLAAVVSHEKTRMKDIYSSNNNSSREQGRILFRSTTFLLGLTSSSPGISFINLIDPQRNENYCVKGTIRCCFS